MFFVKNVVVPILKTSVTALVVQQFPHIRLLPAETAKPE